MSIRQSREPVTEIDKSSNDNLVEIDMYSIAKDLWCIKR